MGIEELTVDAPIRQAFYISPSLIRTGGSRILNRFSRDEGINLLVVDSGLYDWLDDKHCKDGAEQQNVREFFEYGAQRKLRHNTAYLLEDPTIALMIAEAMRPKERATRLADITEHLERMEKWIHGNWHADGKRVSQGKHYSIKKEVPLITVTDDQRDLAVLIGKGVRVEQVTCTKYDPKLAENYVIEVQQGTDLYAAIQELIWTGSEGGKCRHVPEPECEQALRQYLPQRQLIPNQFFVFPENEKPNAKLMVLRNKPLAKRGDRRTVYEPGHLRPVDCNRLKTYMENIWGKGRQFDVRQLIALELITDPDVGAVVLAGRAGSGKTSVAFTSGLLQVLCDRDGFGKYRNMIIAKTQEMVGGKEYEHETLPGNMLEKNLPFYQPYISILEETDMLEPFESLITREEQVRATVAPRHLLFRESSPLAKRVFARAEPFLKILPLGYLRGVNVTGLMLVDEAQNAPVGIIKALVTRITEGGKLVLFGDMHDQIDRAGYSPEYNGLVIPLSMWYGKDFFGVAPLNKNYRSAASRDAADWVREVI